MLSFFFKLVFLKIEQTTFLKRISEEDEDDDNEDDESSTKCKHSKSTEEIITMPGRKGTYILTQSIHQKYEKRPEVLEKMCLAQFALYYNTLTGHPPKKVEFIDNAI